MNWFDDEEGIDWDALIRKYSDDLYDAPAQAAVDPSKTVTNGPNGPTYFYDKDGNFLGGVGAKGEVITNSGLNQAWSVVKNLLTGKGDLGGFGQMLGGVGIASLLNKALGGSGSSGPTGYQGGIPQYAATRTQLPLPYSSSDQAKLAQAVKDSQAQGFTMDQIKQGAQQKFGVAPAEVDAAVAAAPPPYRRPGAGGITYFSPMQYSYSGNTPTTGQGFIPPTPAPTAAPTRQTTPTNPNPNTALASGGYMPGGIAMLAKGGGRFLQGAGDGVSDNIPATIGGTRPARLADGEFVIDARTVSEIGNGSSNAGAKKLYAMMDRVHNERRKAKRGKPSKADKFLPK
jgi:hypothetical protein